jgi:NADH-quinone oxidoreductase subunit N
MGLPPYAAEIATAVLLVAVLLVDFLLPRRADADARSPVWITFLAGTAAILAITLASRGDLLLLSGSYSGDGLSWIAKVVIVVGTGLVGALSRGSLPIESKYHGAYAALVCAASLGMMVLVSSRELITLFVALETSSVSLYGLSALARRDARSLEAGIKYVVVGALSSGVLLYGIALVYTATGTTALDGIRSAVLASGVRLAPAAGSAGSSASAGLSPLFLAGMVLVLLGTGFKISMVPMHVWAPDVYEGAPTAVTAFISVVSKTAGFVFLIRLFSFAFIDLRPWWEPLFMAGAVLSMTVGNLAAIPQKSAKRLLAYSGISQAGYLLVGFLGTASTGASSVLFYLLVYTLTNLAAFSVVIAFSQATGSDLLPDYAGLARRSPLLALVFTLALLSLAGIPPLGGFVGKVYLFAAAMERGYLWLVVVAALNSIISLYYYLLILKEMYISESPVAAGPVPVTFPVKAVLVLATAGMFWLGIEPGQVMGLISDITRHLFAVS